jgi:uncharacterized protein YceK
MKKIIAAFAIALTLQAQKMKKIIAVFVIALTLQGCGGGMAATITSQPAPGVTGASVNDGYGAGLQVQRDTQGQAGGTPGHVNTAAMFHSATGQGVTAFEWVQLAILDNFSTAGENVAAYAQANKHASGPTWAAVSEANDAYGLPGALVAHEFDVFTSGPDNGSRIGLDLVVGDGKLNRGLGRSDTAQASAAIRIGASTNHPWATWGNAIEVKAVSVRDSVFRVTDPAGAVVFEIRPNGDVYKQGKRVL